MAVAKIIKYNKLGELGGLSMVFSDEVNFNKLQNNFKQRNINILFFETFNDAKNYIMNTLPLNATIGIGHSQTLENMKITESLISRGNVVFDKERAKDRAESILLKKKALLTDYYLSSSNAVSEDGRIVNIDHSGNRVAALTYGPDKVLIIVGKNKVVKTQEDAISRAKNVAAPRNAKRAGFNPPCVTAGQCMDCLSTERVCNTISIIQGQHFDDRLVLIIVNEVAGF